MLADGITIGSTISYDPADEFLSTFVVKFIISFSIACGSGLDIIKYSSRPSTLEASV